MILMNNKLTSNPSRSSRIAHRLVGLTLAIATAASLSSCAAFSADDTASDPEGHLIVATSFYPIQWLTERIGGSYVKASSITPENVEPHDFELAPKDIAELSKAQAVIYMPGFQPSLDDAVSSIEGPAVLDLSKAVTLEASDDEGDADHHHEGSEESEHEESHAGHSHAGSLDPHFWLDPVRMKEAAEAISAELSHLDSEHAEAYAAATAKLTGELDELNASYAASLTQCASPIILSSHEAFGYLARRYHLEQASISGIDPEAEPSPAQLRNISDIAKEHKATTIFTESTLSTKAAEAFANEAGLHTETLSALETSPSSGDYLSQMKENLTKLSTGLGCAGAASQAG